MAGSQASVVPDPPPHVEPYRAPPFHLFVWQTFRSVLLHPRAFWADEPFEAPWLPAVAYAGLVSSLGRLGGQWLMDASRFEANWLIGGLAPEFHARHRGVFGWLESTSHGTLRLPLPIGLASWPLRFLLLAVLVHLLCAMAGRGPSGFAGTLRICAYASTPMFFSHLPVLWVPALAYSTVQLGLGIGRLTRRVVPKPPRVAPLPPPRPVRPLSEGEKTLVTAVVVLVVAMALAAAVMGLGLLGFLLMGLGRC